MFNNNWVRNTEMVFLSTTNIPEVAKSASLEKTSGVAYLFAVRIGTLILPQHHHTSASGTNQ
jgi:hypothetical protein